RKDWDYYLYLVLKPEYEEKVIETRWKGKVGVTVEHRNYNISVDAENDTVTLGDVCDPSSAPSVEYEKLELHMYKADHRYKEGYLSLAYIFMPKDYSNNSYVARAESYTLDPFLYPLVLKK
ncbi:MAG: hypothetical protein IJC68_01050, partial [Firmicutes bacterium]|nr:hypothetical protein [Bacillota bacterium]